MGYWGGKICLKGWNEEQMGYLKEEAGEKTLWGGHFKQEDLLLFGYILYYFGGMFSLISSSILINI